VLDDGESRESRAAYYRKMADEADEFTAKTTFQQAREDYARLARQTTRT
jgi:hypothetical protein